MSEWYFPPRTHCLLCVDPVTVVDWDTGDGIVWLNTNMEAVPGPPPEGTQEWRTWQLQGYLPYCAGSPAHPLPKRDSITMVLIGPSASGKDSLAKHLATHCGDIMRREGGLTIATPRGTRPDLIKAFSAGATAPASPEKPHLANHWDLRHSNGRTTATLMLFNTAGEDLIQGDERGFRYAFRVVPYADILVFFVPPSTLIPELDQGGADNRKTQDWFASIADFVTRLQPLENQPRTVVVALTKCDKYADVDDFPKTLLSDRPGNRWSISDLIREQAQIADFIMSRPGGENLLDTLAPLSVKVFLTAISGTGVDHPLGRGPDEVVAGAHEAPPPNSAPIRAFDPLIIGLMRAGIWQEPDT